MDTFAKPWYPVKASLLAGMQLNYFVLRFFRVTTVSKNQKTLAQDARVMLGRPPIQSSMLQQMFYKCVSATRAASSASKKTSHALPVQPPAKQKVIQIKKPD